MDSGALEPGMARFLPDAIETLVGLGELGEAEHLTDWLEERGRALDRASALATGARCRALLLSVKALKPEPGDEFITTPFTFFATAGAVVNGGGSRGSSTSRRTPAAQSVRWWKRRFAAATRRTRKTARHSSSRSRFSRS